MIVQPAVECEFVLETGETGLVGTVSVRVVFVEGGTAIPASTADIVENPPGSGVYVATRISPATRDDYIIQWSLDGTYDDESIVTDDLQVRSNAYPGGGSLEPTGRDLCTLDDVKLLVPGYNGTESDDILTAFITSESESIHDETGREIVANGNQPASRAFLIDGHGTQWRRIEIGDLAAAGDTDIVVELINTDGAVAETIARDRYIALYDNQRRYAKAPWEPIVELEFPAALGAQAFSSGQTLLITGNFGFPEIPSFIRMACAKRVILRYASDVAATGTQLAAAIAEVNLAGLFASSRDDVYRLKRMVMIS